MLTPLINKLKLLGWVGAVLSVLITTVALAAPAKPKLVLQITVDQLRGDLPLRYLNRFENGGFRRLYRDGAVFFNAHHAHANTETIVGHTTLATGAHPSEHGMVGNLWLDRSTGKITYNIEDGRYRLLTEDAGVSANDEIDPTQRAARSEGRSPAAILVSTISDEIRLASQGTAKSIAVSVKDRGAVAMAGHAGTAYWFSKTTGQFVTSNYYAEKYPQWVTAFNAASPTARYGDQAWTLAGDIDNYLFGTQDDQAWETDIGGFGRTFPHPYPAADNRYFTTLLTLSPAGDELVIDFAKQAIIGEKLGRDDETDYLSISLSSTDYVGHIFGPSSLEAEDNLLRLDQGLAALLDFVDREVGIENTLVILSADHGAAEAPGTLTALNIPAGYFDPDQIINHPYIEKLQSQYRLESPIIASYTAPYIYLSQEVRRLPEQTRQALVSVLQAQLADLPGVASTVYSEAIARGQPGTDWLTQAVAHNFHPARSGDIYVVLEPHIFINDFDGLTVTATHGSPWSYDTHVPLIFAGWQVKPNSVYRRVDTVSVAPTLSQILSIKSPSGAVGEPLTELLDNLPR